MDEIIPVEDLLHKQYGRQQVGRGVDETKSGTAGWWVHDDHCAFCLPSLNHSQVPHLHGL